MLFFCKGCVKIKLVIDMKIDKILEILEHEENELWLRAKIVLQFVGLRESKGYTQEDVANILGVSKQLISRFERMEHSPTLSFIVKYAKALDSDVNTIISFRDIKQISLDNNQIERMNNIITYSNGEISIDVNFDYEHETIWLNQNQIADLFQVDKSRISRHIKNILEDGELETSTIAENATVQFEGEREVKRIVKFYNLDMIISIGYRVNSKRGIEFRKWVTNILKQYMYKGYAINQKRLEILNKVVEIQNKMLATALDISTYELKEVIDKYSYALDLLDDYDHQKVVKPNGNDVIHKIEYAECRSIIDSMKFGDSSNLFGVEKEDGKLNGILEAVYQNVFGVELYPTIEEKAAHLLYFIVKDHPFVDGCKRIAATMFLEFLNKNKRLVKDGRLCISNNTLVAITLLTAESRPDEKEVIINVIMHLLNGIE